MAAQHKEHEGTGFVVADPLFHAGIANLGHTHQTSGYRKLWNSIGIVGLFGMGMLLPTSVRPKP